MKFLINLTSNFCNFEATKLSPVLTYKRTKKMGAFSSRRFDIEQQQHQKNFLFVLMLLHRFLFITELLTIKSEGHWSPEITRKLKVPGSEI